MTLIGFGLIAIAIGYVAGSLSSAVLVAKVFDLPDPREVGSKNPGATNILRMGGKLPAVLTLLGDGLKGFIPLYAFKLYGLSLYPLKDLYPILGMMFLSALLGHLYPVFFKFKGGKGVATALGGLFALHAGLGLSFVGIWLCVAFLTRYSALSALVASALLPFIGYSIAFEYGLALFIAALFIFWRHRVNMGNLLQGKEPKMGQRLK